MHAKKETNYSPARRTGICSPLDAKTGLRLERPLVEETEKTNEILQGYSNMTGVDFEQNFSRTTNISLFLLPTKQHIQIVRRLRLLFQEQGLHIQRCNKIAF